MVSRWLGRVVLVLLAAAITAGVRSSPAMAQGMLAGTGEVAQANAPAESDIPLELVDLSGLTAADIALLIDQPILTTAQVELRGATGAEAVALSQRRLHPATNAPFQTVLTGAAVVYAQAQFDSISGRHRVDVELNDAGADTIAAFTESRVGEALGIVVYGRVVSAPIVRSRLGRQFVIEGNFSEEEARELAARLMNVSPQAPGALPDPRAPLLFPVDFSLIVDSIGAILLLAVLLLL